MEEKLKSLSSIIVNYSLKVKKDERVLITYQSTDCNDLISNLLDDIWASGGIAYLKLVDPIMNTKSLEYTNDKKAKIYGNYSKFEVDNYDCFISIRYLINEYQDKNVTSNTRKMIHDYTKEYDEIRINDRRWVLLNYPSNLDAYKSKMNSDDFRNYSLNVMTVDYRDLFERVKPLKKLMEKTDKVRLVSKNTDITFSIKNMPIIPCCGECNLPDGEIFTSPVKDSVNGIITYNTPSPYRGNVYHDVSLTFRNGKIIKCTCNEDNKQLEEIFNTDEGARYIGEFSLGLNPEIMNPMGDILYDEKIIGSIHFTPGQAYHEADNTNRSAIHWDMVLIQRNDFGGGELYFDDVLIRKDGLFVLENLKQLNYDLK